MRLMGCIMFLFVAMVHIGCETPQGGGAAAPTAAPTAAAGSTDAGGTLTDADLKRMGIVEMNNNR